MSRIVYGQSCARVVQRPLDHSTLTMLVAAASTHLASVMGSFAIVCPRPCDVLRDGCEPRAQPVLADVCVLLCRCAGPFSFAVAQSRRCAVVVGSGVMGEGNGAQARAVAL